MAESILTQRNFVFLLQAISPTSQRCILFANAALRKHIENLSAYLRFQFPYTCFISIAHGSFDAHPLLTLWMMSWLPLHGAHDAADLASRSQLAASIVWIRERSERNPGLFRAQSSDI